MNPNSNSYVDQSGQGSHPGQDGQVMDLDSSHGRSLPIDITNATQHGIPAQAPPLLQALAPTIPYAGPITVTPINSDSNPILQPTVPVPSVSSSLGVDPNNTGEVETPLEAADAEVIEPEWVNKAKKIVAETHQNPHLQVRQMNILKADYMKKRYNKDIKFPRT